MAALAFLLVVLWLAVSLAGLVVTAREVREYLRRR